MLSKNNLEVRRLRDKRDELYSRLHLNVWQGSFAQTFLKEQLNKIQAELDRLETGRFQRSKRY